MTALHTRHAEGLLARFDLAGVLAPADVHVATRLGLLAGETDERVLLAVALTVRSTRHASVVLDLAEAAATTTADAEDADARASDGNGADDVGGDAVDDGVDVAALPWPEVDEWVTACAASPLVVPGEGGAPLHLVGSRLWLDRYWSQEVLVADELRRRAADVPADLDVERLDADLAELFPAPSDADQRAATRVAALARVSVIGGGPGTGKTTTIARLIATLRRQRPALRIALAAPTGRAAARLEEAVRSAAGSLTDDDRAGLATMSARTLHRLLGWRPEAAGRFRHDRDNRLPFDVVIVDESSMVPLTMTARLLEALGLSTRLVLVGDPDQLASVEAGAVLGDIVDAGGGDESRGVAPAAAEGGAAASADGSATPAGIGPLRGCVSLLRTVRRFEAGGAIAVLAEHVRSGRANDALAVLEQQPAGVEFVPVVDDEPITGPALAVVRARAEHELAVIAAARAGDADAALRALDRHRMLCAHRGGPRGERFWTQDLERVLLERDPALVPRLDGHYAGQPLLVTSNDYDNALFNGDTGVVVQDGDTGELVAAFRRGADVVRLPLVRLSDVRAMHVMTVHRAQGSQFAEVTVLLPVASSPLATRQTLYTALTRAAEHVRIIGSPDAVRACVLRPAARATGLRERLLGELA